MKNLLVLGFLCIGVIAKGQNVEGYWYGNANVTNGGSANNYLVELILDQKGTSVQGVINYYFKNTFRSIKATGNYNSLTRQLSLYNIPVTYFASSNRMEVDCPMDLSASLRVAKAGSNLKGSFVSKEQYKYTCPEVHFDLKLNKDATNQDSILTALRNYKEAYQVWTPSATDTSIAATIIQRPIVNFVVTNEYKQREKEIAEEIVVESDSLLIDFYDNGEIDGDSISVFYNDQLLASSQRLSAKAIHIKVGLDSTRDVNEITMFADNLGSIPPNTALMLVYDGRKRYEVRLSSTLQKNGTVRIRKKESK